MKPTGWGKVDLNWGTWGKTGSYWNSTKGRGGDFMDIWLALLLAI